MTTYRVGAEGATVFNEKGEAIARLRPGYVVVEGTTDTSESLAVQHERSVKRVRGYADKKLRPEDDK